MKENQKIERRFKKMKNTKLYIAMALVLMALAVFASASVLADSNTSDSGSTTAINAEVNDSLDGSVSGARIGWEHFKLWFTFNNEAKINQELVIARLRLIQAKVAAQNGDNASMQSALDAHDKLIDDIKSRIGSIDGESTKEGVLNSTVKLVGLERAIEVHEARISKLNEILVNSNLTDEQKAKIEARISQAENNTAHLRDVEDAKKEMIKTRLRAIGNMTKDEVDSEIEGLEDAQNLSAVRKAVAEIRLARAEFVIGRIKERLANFSNETGKNLTNAEQRLSNVEERIGRLRTNLNQSEEADSSTDVSADVSVNTK